MFFSTSYADILLVVIGVKENTFIKKDIFHNTIIGIFLRVNKVAKLV